MGKKARGDRDGFSIVLRVYIMLALGGKVTHADVDWRSTTTPGDRGVEALNEAGGATEICVRSIVSALHYHHRPVKTYPLGVLMIRASTAATQARMADKAMATLLMACILR